MDQLSESASEGLRHFLIAGKVQGVGFRRFVEACGQRLGVAGFVRNLVDGRVEAIAWGRNREFEAELARGPKHSRVDSLKVHDQEPGAWTATLGVPDQFTVLADGETEWFRY